MNTAKRFAIAAACLLAAATAARADEHPFVEGPVVNTYAIRTEPGKFDDYMEFLEKIWKPTQEAARKFGFIESYRVIKVEPRGENDPDIYLMVTYKNWAALDGATAKADAVAREVEGSLSEANRSTAARGKIRRLLGSWTGQQLDLN